MKIDFIGIGAQKAATTWISACLKSHPEICFSEPKELNFFNDEDEFYIPPYENFSKGESWYLNFFKSCPEGKIKGEFSTSYLSDPIAAKRIFDFENEVKIICCLRNPFDRMYSQYLHIKRKRPGVIDEIGSFEQAITDYPDFIERSLYYKNLSRYLKYFLPANIHVMTYDEIQINPQEELSKLYAFLNVDSTFISPFLDSIINKGSKEPLFKNLDSFLNKKISINVDDNLPKKIYILLRRLNKNFSKGQTPFADFPESTTTKIHDDIKKLESKFKLNLNNWYLPND